MFEPLTVFGHWQFPAPPIKALSALGPGGNKGHDQEQDGAEGEGGRLSPADPVPSQWTQVNLSSSKDLVLRNENQYRVTAEQLEQEKSLSLVS